MVINRYLESGKVLCSPCQRRRLLPRIGPGIAVMKINHQPHPEVFCPDSFCQYICSIVPSGRRIYPYPEPDCIHTEAFQELHAFQLCAARIIKFDTWRFHLCQPADVSTFCQYICRSYRIRRWCFCFFTGNKSCKKNNQQVKGGFWIHIIHAFSTAKRHPVERMAF